jgi:16S rRNA (guanine527-N7)-methyltransferase
VSGGDDSFDLDAAVADRARDFGVDLAPGALEALVAHARQVMAAGPELHLTAIEDPAEFVDRHVGEALQGAALLPAGVRGILLDLGSGNGYPGLPLCVVHRGLTPLLADASRRRAAFLRHLMGQVRPEGAVLELHLQRPADLPEPVPVRVLTTRAMGGWHKIVPRLAPLLAADGEVLLWAGEDVDAILRRAAWKRLTLVERHPLVGRERSWIYRLRRR